MTKIERKRRALVCVQQPSSVDAFKADAVSRWQSDPLDRTAQDVMVHADMWIGFACVLGAFSYAAGYLFLDLIPDLMVNVVLTFQMAGVCWLVILGFMTGMLFDTNRGIGLPQILPATQDSSSLLENQQTYEIDQGWSRVAFLSILFVAEAVLLVLGVYLEGWPQYVMGGIGLLILMFVFISNLNKTDLRRAVAHETERLAQLRAVELKRKGGGKTESDTSVRNRRYLEGKKRRLFILTACDFTLAALGGAGCVMIDQTDPYGVAAVFLAFLSLGSWLIILGLATGHGKPGHHHHPFLGQLLPGDTK